MYNPIDDADANVDYYNRNYLSPNGESNKWLAEQRDGRFSFVFTPKHGSWLNLVEGFFSKMARSVLRRIRVASKAELKQRILAYLDDINREPVVHTWSYRITLPA